MQVQGPHKRSQTLIGLIQPYLTIIPPPPHLDIILQINMIWTIYFDNFNILDVYDLFIVFEMYSPFCTWPSNWLKITEICPNKNSRKRKKQDSVAQDPKKSHWEAFSSLCSSVEKNNSTFLDPAISYGQFVGAKLRGMSEGRQNYLVEIKKNSLSLMVGQNKPVLFPPAFLGFSNFLVKVMSTLSKALNNLTGSVYTHKYI